MLRNSQEDILCGSTLYLHENSVLEINGIVNLWDASILVGGGVELKSGILNLYTLSKIVIKGKSTIGQNIAIARNCYITDTDSHIIETKGKPCELIKNNQNAISIII